MQLSIGIMASLLCGGLAGACVRVFFNRLFHWRELRTRFYPVLGNMFSAYVLRVANAEGRHWTTIAENTPSPEDDDFVDHRSSFLSGLAQYNELKEVRVLRRKLLDNAMRGNHNPGQVAKLDLTSEAAALGTCLARLHNKLKI